MSLAAATRSETTKQFTTAGWWILLLVLFVYVGFTALALGWVLAASATGALPGDQAPQVPADVIPPLLYSLAASVGYVFPLLVGTLMVTGEFRHQALTPTFLATPRRGVVLWAKVLVGILLGVIFAIVGLLSSVGPGAAFLSGFGLDTAFGSSDTWALFGRVVIALVLWALVGIGVGTLVRNQVAAIVIVLAFTQFVEPIARFAASLVDGLGTVTQYLPGAASDALVGASVFTAMGGQTGDVAQLEWWVGGLVLAGYALLFLVLGHLLSWRRDVS